MLWTNAGAEKIVKFFFPLSLTRVFVTFVNSVSNHCNELSMNISYSFNKAFIFTFLKKLCFTKYIGYFHFVNKRIDSSDYRDSTA